MNLINTLENALDKKAKLNMMPVQAGGVKITNTDTSSLEKYALQTLDITQ